MWLGEGLNLKARIFTAMVLWASKRETKTCVLTITWKPLLFTNVLTLHRMYYIVCYVNP